MKNILYVDDNKDDREAAFRIFAHGKYNIKCAANAAEGFMELHSHPYDLAVCDMMMPGMDGLSFAKKLAHSGLSIPLILTSGIEDLRAFENYHGLGNYRGFIQKPLTPEKIEEVMEREAA